MEEPTCEQLMDEDGLERVSREVSGEWRHGSEITQVFKREADGTYWRAVYRVSTDGETNELREGSANISQVHQKTKTITVYE